MELAEDDLVLSEEDRAEVADAGYEAGSDPLVERAYVLVPDVRPEALGDEVVRFRIHAVRSYAAAACMESVSSLRNRRAVPAQRFFEPAAG